MNVTEPTTTPAPPIAGPSPYAFMVNGDVFFDPSPKQLEALIACLSGKWPNIFIWGNRGGGKSWMARFLCHMLAMRFPGFRYKIIRKRFGELQETHLDFLTAEMKKLGGDYNKTEHTAHYPNGSIGYYRPCATAEDVEKALGAEAYLCVFDEAPTLEWDHMVLITGSVRVPKEARDRGVTPLVLYLGNPIGASIDQLWAYFIDKNVDPEENDNYFPGDYHAIELRMEDNPHQDVVAYRRRLASQTNPQYRKAWLDGERSFKYSLFDFRPTIRAEAIIDGQVVEIEKPYHVIDDMPMVRKDDGREVPIIAESWVRIYRSYDHGFHTSDPAVCLWFAVFGKRILVFKEQFITNTDAEGVARQILNAQIAHVNGEPYVLPVSMTYHDPSINMKLTSKGATYVDTKFAMESVTVTVPGSSGRVLRLSLEPSVNSREQFADAIHRFLNAEAEPGVPRIQFLRHGCPQLIKHIPLMTYDPKNPAKMADHRFDDGPVALAYFLMSHIPSPHPAEPSNRPPWWDDFFIAGTNIPRPPKSTHR